MQARPKRSLQLCNIHKMLNRIAMNVYDICPEFLTRKSDCGQSESSEARETCFPALQQLFWGGTGTHFSVITRPLPVHVLK